MINQMNQIQSQDPVLVEYMENMYVWIWLVGTFTLAGFMSMLKWLNTPMPKRTVGRAVLAFMNGMSISLLTALFLGDKVLSHEISIFQFTFYVMVASFGGSHLLDIVTDFVMRSLESAIAKIFPDDNDKSC